MARKARSELAKALEAAGLEGAKLIGEVQRLELKPGDLVVLKCEDTIRPEFEVYLRKQAARLFPGHETIVIHGGIDLQVVSAPESEAGE